MKKISRCTCDIDDRDIKSLLRCLKVFKRYGFIHDLEVHQSPSGTGFHVIAWKPPHQGVSKKKLMKIRRKAGDDRIRMMLDSKANRMGQVLFTQKTKNKANMMLDGIPMEIEVQGTEVNVKVSYGET